MQILDGAIGTELAARGVALGGVAWSAGAMTSAPDELEAVHAAYSQAGATLHTANTFRTQRGVLGDQWIDALGAAVRIAKRAVPRGHHVLGSLAPVEDCYRPDRSPGRSALPLHRESAQALADAGCDIILCETFSHEEEALAAVEASLDTGLPVWLSLTAGPAGDLLVPADLGRIARSAFEGGAARVLVNCTAATRIQPFVDALASLDVPFGVYANAGGLDEGIGWGAAAADGAARYAALASRWADSGATVIGGCCGTGPAHIAALAKRWA
jgi:S-methylmethionine-dependent homocysteine/selenocysteine methylase